MCTFLLGCLCRIVVKLALFLRDFWTLHRQHLLQKLRELMTELSQSSVRLMQVCTYRQMKLFCSLFRSVSENNLLKKIHSTLSQFAILLGTETIKLNSTSAPAVITCDLRLNTPRYPTMPNIMKAKKKPVQTISLEDMVSELGLNLDDVLNPKNEVVEVYEPPPRKEGEMVDSVDELIGKLSEKGLVA